MHTYSATFLENDLLSDKNRPTSIRTVPVAARGVIFSWRIAIEAVLSNYRNHVDVNAGLDGSQSLNGKVPCDKAQSRDAPRARKRILNRYTGFANRVSSR